MKAIDRKLWGVLGELNQYHEEHKTEITEETPYVAIKRYDLRLKLVGRLEIFATHTLHKWIDYALAKGFLIQNPTSHLLSDGKSIRPDNDTRYFINIEAITLERQRLIKVMEKAQAQSTIQFTKPDVA